MILQETVNRLREMYSGGNRFYHNWQHVNECLGHLNNARGIAKNFQALEAAILFHDSVYDTRANDNEEKSAELACEMLRGQLPKYLIEEVVDLILVTKYGERPNSFDERLMADIDIGIFGAERNRYAEYASQVRKEYGWVPKKLFDEKRKEVLSHFLGSPIYSTNFFKERYGEIAERNLKWEMGTLGTR